jgi:hypothetical protein
MCMHDSVCVNACKCNVVGTILIVRSITHTKNNKNSNKKKASTSCNQSYRRADFAARDFRRQCDDIRRHKGTLQSANFVHYDAKRPDFLKCK